MSDVRRSDDSLDVPLEDEELLDEVELLTELIIAAGVTPGALEPEQIDRVLNVGK